MGKIENFNCYELCCEKFCSDKYTHYLPLTNEGIEVYLMLCEKHYTEVTKIRRLRA